ncbi:uncharacterized protein LOC121729363 [Aricia agestis]|uniref:uncharacterized protein LOC121729363 n=1 Tax=Aricia agestis TaxID=91739 RepID=UPI001C20B658|nr:uncharacterized protein LOC121729363 [Aricia agestis]
MLVFVKFLLIVSVCESYARRVPEHNGTENIEELAKKPVCHYSDPNVAECIKRVAEQGRLLLAHGIPAFGIQPLEPLNVPSIRLRQHNMPQMRFKYDAWLSDISLHGLTNYTFNKLDVFPEELRVTANISLPHLLIAAEYVIIGDFQMLPVESTGKLKANFTDCSAALDAVGARVHKRMVIRDANVKLRCSGPLAAKLMEAHSTTGEMEMITDHIVHMHSAEIAKEIQPAVETALSMVLEDVANKFLKLGTFVCPREEKALGRCLKDALNKLIPQLSTGVPQYDIPPCEPLLVPSLFVKQSAGPISVESSYSDVTVWGPSRMKIKHVDVDSSKHRVVAKLHIPELRMRGNYKLKGQLLMLPIEGEGKFTAKYNDIDATVTIILGRHPRKTGVDALACTSLDVKFAVDAASMELENLFGGDDELGSMMNKFLNDNWKELSGELQGPMEEALRDFLKPLADHAFASLNADDILS